MDVRQLTLAAKPTAVLADRPNFLGLPKRLLAVLLANVMFWQPIWAMADGIAVSGTTNTQVGKAGNGVPVVNIAAPNAAGLSHNQYERYNVDSQGLILNNSTQAIQGTQLGGNILGNQQLGGRAASTILNEVNGANATQLKGYTEVAGQAARVIVANPHGVTCNGCGFINTPRVTLSTGKPVLDATGKLDHFAVDGGSISIEGQGLDASNIDQFDLITRSAKLNADLYAKRLNVVAGANDVDADTLATTPRQGDPADKPQLAIDSSALGGMYADTIKLVGTEQGVGVKTAGNLAASAGDIQIDANGQLNMAQASAKGALNVTAPSVEMTGKAYASSINVRTPGELVNRQSLAARERVEIDAGTLSNPGTVAAGIENDNSRNAVGDVTVRAASLDNTGTLQASRNLTVEASQRIDNRGVLQAQRTQLTTATLSNQGKAARVVGEQALFVAAPAIVNLGGVLLFGNGQDVTLDLARLDNREGLLQAVNGKLTLNVATLDNAAGQIDAKTLNVSSDTLDNRGGLLSASGGDAQVTARMRLDNRDGTVQAQRHLNASTGQADNQGGRLLAVTGDLDLATTGLDNRNGSLLGTGVRVTAPQADIDNRQGKIIGERLDLDVAELDNRQGQIIGEQLAITAKRLDNRDQGLLAAGTQGLTLDFARSATQAQLLNDGGRVQSDGSLLLRGAWLDNSGGTVIGRSLSLDTQRLYNNAKGALVSDGGDVQLSVSDVLSNLTGIIDAGQHGVTLDGAAAVDNSGGSLRGQRLDLHANTLNNGQGGQLVAGSDGLRYTGGTLNNDAGIVLATAGTTALQLVQAALSNLGGIVQGDSVDIAAGRLDNGSLNGKAGSIASLVGGLTLNVATLANAGGTLFAKTALRSNGTTLANTQGGQISGETLDLEASQVDNHGGLIEANSRFTLSARALDNRDGQLTALGHSPVGLTAASDLSRLELTGSLLNQNGRIAAGNTDFSLKAALLDNRSGRIEHAGDGLLSLAFDRVSGAGGRITALGAGDWQFGQVDGLGSVQLNRALTYTSDALALQAGDRLASASNLTLNLARLDNGGELLSDGDLTLNLSGDLNNRGRLSAQGLVAINAGNVTQNGGRIGAGTDARLSLTGNLDNLGYLTARQALAIDATQILNRGTLGAQGAVTLNAERISNDPDTLLFSGGPMALRAQVFSNLYGDVYSRGDLSVANRDGNAAQRFSNLSGTVESEGAITLNAASVENAKASFELGESIVSGSLSWVCGQHCAGHDSFKRGTITIEQTLLERATQDSPGARLVAGKDLTIQASDVQNRYSLLAANGNLSITANDLLNLGATERTGQQKIVIGTPGRIDTGYWDQMEYIDVPAFNAAVAAGDFDLARFELLKARSADARFSEESNVTTWSDSSKPLYAATLQAGGTVNLNVARSVQNGSVSEHNALEILTGTLGDDQTGVPVGGIDITLNKQAVDASAATVGALPSVQRVTDANGQTTIVPVDYSGIPFAAVDPTAGPTFQLPQGDYGLFVRNPDPNGHYLIETNPNFTDLSRFLGSDYLLERLDIGPDANWRRLGDGLYEQRLIRDAVLAQTGQRFLADGLVSDYDQYRYLMDNALASKDALNLSLGVALTSAQVGALTHDIVWMENRVVDGQTVLVPTLYLAQVDARNVRGSSLIQGRDLNLISGGDLVNVGTLRASRDLSVSSGGSTYQGGLVEAGNNLQLIAQDSIRNAMAGQIRGENVSLAAVRGDVTTERTAIQVRDGAGYRTVTDAGSGVSARQDLAVSAGRDVTNYGTLQAGRDVALQAGNDVKLLAKTDSSEKHETFQGGHRSVITTDVKNLGSNVTAEGDIGVSAQRDINVRAANATAAKDLNVQASRDLSVVSGIDVHNVDVKEKSGKKRTASSNGETTRADGVLTAGQDFTSITGRDTTLVASKVVAGHEAYLYANNDINLEAGETSKSSYYAQTKKGSWGKKSSKMSEDNTTQAVGSVIESQGSSTVAAARNVNFIGSAVKTTDGGVVVLAGNDVNLDAAQNTHFTQTAKSKSSGFGFSTTRKMSSDSATTTSTNGSTLSGDTTSVQAGRNVSIVGSNVVSTNETNIRAGNDVRIDSAAENFTAQHRQVTKKSGLMGSGGIGITLGSAKDSFKQGTVSQTQRGSTVGSVLGDVNVSAGKDVDVIASEIVAGKDIRLGGQNVRITDAANEASTQSQRESKKSGLTLALSGVVGEAVNTTVQNAQEAKREDDSRLTALQGVKAGLSGYQSWQAAQALESGAQAGSFFGLALSLGSQKSSSKQLEEQIVSQGSSLTAGNSLSVVATGNHQSSDTGGDIVIQGSKLQAGNDILLSAARDIDLRSGLNTQRLDGSNKSSGGAVGLSFGFGSSGAGLSVFANGNSGSGKEQGDGTVWTETTVNAGNQLTINSGRDTTLEGAQASAQRIVADVKRNLTLSSQQDTDRYDSKQANVSGGASFTFGTMTGGGSLSVSQNKIKSDFDSVSEQTGLFAGKDGYQINVGNHTQLDGSVIGSTASADKNSLSTGTLGWSNISNKADFTSQSQSVTGGTGGSSGTPFTGNMSSLFLSGSNHQGDASSTTYSAISEGAINIRNAQGQQQDVSALNRDVEHANNALSPIFDKEKEQKRLRQAQLIADIASQSMDIIRTEGSIEAAKAAQAELNDKNMPGADPNASYEDRLAYVEALQGTSAYKKAMDTYGTGSSLQRAAQAVTAAVQGLAAGNLGQAAVRASAPYIAGIIKDNTGDDLQARLMAHAVLGAVLAKSQQNSAIAGATGASIGELVASQLYPDTPVDQLTEIQKQQISALSTLAGGLAGGIAGGDSANALAGAEAAKNAVENNQLRGAEEITLLMKQKEFAESCKGVSSANCQALSEDISELLKKAGSVLPETAGTVDDFLITPAVSHKPGDLVACSVGNGVCVVSSKTTETNLGREFLLESASPEQTETFKAQTAADVAATKVWLDDTAKEQFDAGCAGMGPVGIGCQSWMALSGVGPITGKEATPAQRALYGAQAVLNATGLLGLTAGVGGGPKEAGEVVSPIVPGGGLAAHEAAGGHLLAKHVGQSEAQLLSRLSAEPKITGSSSFYDRTVAEKAVSKTLDVNQTEIANWLSGSANRLRLDHTLSHPVGISVARGASGAVDTNSVRLILVRDSKIPTGYKILTGFPTVP